MKDYNILNNKQLFVGFLLRSQVISLLEDGPITERQVENLQKKCLEPHRTTFLYALNHFPLEDEFLENSNRKSLTRQCVSILSKVNFLVGGREREGRRAARLCA